MNPGVNLRATSVPACHPVEELNTDLKLLFFFSKGTEYDSPQIYATPRPDQSAEIAEFGKSTVHVMYMYMSRTSQEGNEK